VQILSTWRRIHPADGTDVTEMEAFFGREIRVLTREDVEQDPMKS